MADNKSRVMCPIFEIHNDIQITMNKNGRLGKVNHSETVVYPHNFQLKDPEFISNAFICVDCGLEALENYEEPGHILKMKSFDAEKKCVK